MFRPTARIEINTPLGSTERIDVVVMRAATPGMWNLVTEEEWGTEAIPSWTVDGNGVVRCDGKEPAGQCLLRQIDGAPAVEAPTQERFSHEDLIAVLIAAIGVTAAGISEFVKDPTRPVQIVADPNALLSLLSHVSAIVAAGVGVDPERYLSIHREILMSAKKHGPAEALQRAQRFIAEATQRLLQSAVDDNLQCSAFAVAPSEVPQ